MISVVFGEYALSGAMITAVAVLLGAAGYVGTKNEGLLRGVRWGMVLMAAMLSVSCWALLGALLSDNFAVDYVARHSEKALSTGYKIAAFWAGQEGSLLLWAWMLAVMGAVLAWRQRKEENPGTAVALGVMAAVAGFFVSVMLFAGSGETSGNPFRAAKGAMEISGLNPALQNWMMVVHPPMLFLGYAAFTVPFALMLGALWGGGGSQKPEARSQKDAWLGEGRVWMVFAWVSLTVGIVLGAGWAYVVLGWGGYWGWDPVENASLLPWLTGTALLHSAVMQTRRGMFKRWTASLTAASFFLCVFGTYVTRSGVVKSVHSFGDSPIGTFFLVFLVVMGVVSVGTVVMRWGELKGEQTIEEMVSREGMILAGNVLLVVMTVVMIVGTLFPRISEMAGAEAVTVKGEFYNRVVLPMALVVAALMATGPVLGFGAGAFERVKGKLLGMALAGLAAAVAVGVLGYREMWALAAAWTVTAVAAGFAIDVMVSMKGAGMRGLAARGRHWGAQLGHLGLAAMVAGVAGSGLYGLKEDLTFTKPVAHGGEEVRVGKYTLGLVGVEAPVRRENYVAVAARFVVKEDGGKQFELKPERRFYDRGMKEGDSTSEVAIRFGWLSDVYLNLAGFDVAEGSAVVETFINPLVNWIWIGAGLMSVGGLVCLLTGRGEVRGQAMVEEPRSPERETRREGMTARERRRAMQIGQAPFKEKR